MYEYIKKDTIKKMNNYELLIYMTEEFTLFGSFLEEKRGYKKLDLKIGKFNYDGADYEIFLILDMGPKFKHVRLYDNRVWYHKTLTEQLIYAWGFKEIEFEFDINLINDIYNILNSDDKEYYNEMYDEIHSLFW